MQIDSQQLSIIRSACVEIDLPHGVWLQSGRNDPQVTMLQCLASWGRIEEQRDLQSQPHTVNHAHTMQKVETADPPAFNDMFWNGRGVLRVCAQVTWTRPGARIDCRLVCDTGARTSGETEVPATSRRLSRRHDFTITSHGRVLA